MKKLILLFSLLMTTALYAQNKGFTPKPPRKAGDPLPKCLKKHIIFGVDIGPASMVDSFRKKDGVHIWVCPIPRCKHFIIHEEQCKPIKVGDKYRCRLHSLYDFIQSQEKDSNGKPYFYCEFSKFRYHGELKNVK